MTEWRNLVMRDVMIEFHDGPHATPSPADAGPVYLGIKNITEAGLLELSQTRHIAEEDFAKWTRRVTPQPGDVVFTYEATLHRYAIIPRGFRGCLGRRLALIRPDEDVVLPRFLHFAMLGPAWRETVTSRIISGSTVDRIPIIDFPDFPIAVPDLATQRAVVEVLGSIDDLIENNRRRIELLEQMAQAIYREWFVHFCYPGHEEAALVDSPIGPIPEGWEVKTIGEVVELRYGRALKAADRSGGPVAVVGSSDVVGWHDETLVEGPAIVVGRKGNVGNVTWVPGPCWPIDTTYYVATDIPLRYAYEQLSRAEFINTHAAVPGLSRTQAYGLPFLLPPARLTAEFADISEDLGSNALLLRAQSEQLAGIRDLLLPKLVTGKIDVSNLDLDAALESVA